MNTANKNGILFGLLCPGELRTKKGEPVAYLYNGVRLPKLPDVDGDYCAYLRTSSQGTARLHIATSAVKVRFDDDLNYAVALADGTQRQFDYRPDRYGERWVENEPSNKTYSAGDVVFPFDRAKFAWANCTVKDEDGNLYLAASDPIPIYE